MSESQKPIVVLFDIKYETFLCVLAFLYTGECKLTNNNVFEVLRAGDMYVLKSLVELCESYLKRIISMETVLDVLLAAFTFSLRNLLEECILYIHGCAEKIDKEELDRKIRDGTAYEDYATFLIRNDKEILQNGVQTAMF